MGMMVGGIRSNRKVIQIKNRDGSVAATVSISKPQQKKAKRLPYNFKSISSQIMISKNSVTAGKAVTKARGTIAALLKKMYSGDYDDKEIEQAVAHARKMERIAKKRVKHLKQEEEAKEKGDSAKTQDELEEIAEEESQETELELSEEEMQKLLEEYQRLMQESMEELSREMSREAEAEELSEDFETAVHEMDEEDLERMKKKHRSDEMRDIIDADMKYLRAVFYKLQKEKEALSNGSGSAGTSGVSLEISGLEMPVDVPQVPAAAGGSIDLML